MYCNCLGLFGVCLVLKRCILVQYKMHEVFEEAPAVSGQELGMCPGLWRKPLGWAGRLWFVLWNVLRFLWGYRNEYHQQTFSSPTSVTRLLFRLLAGFDGYAVCFAQGDRKDLSDWQLGRCYAQLLVLVLSHTGSTSKALCGQVMTRSTLFFYQYIVLLGTFI